MIQAPELNPRCRSDICQEGHEGRDVYNFAVVTEEGVGEVYVQKTELRYSRQAKPICLCHHVSTLSDRYTEMNTHINVYMRLFP